MVESVHLFVLSVLVFGFGLLSRRFARGVLTGPLAFVVFGLLLSPAFCAWAGLGQLFGELEGAEETIHLLGEITLTIVLFTDAAQIRLATLRRGARIPIRLLLIGMPLTILLGAGLAFPLFGELGVFELLLLATMLAPTDAALGQAVVTSDRVPVRIRQGLSVESGLNDGIAVPFVIVFGSFASLGGGNPGESVSLAECAGIAVQALTLGPLAGVVVGGAGAWLMTHAIRRGWMEHAYQELAGIALAIIAYVGASLVGGNGFIAAFVAGIVVGNSTKEVGRGLYDFAEAEAQLLMLVTFFMVGLVLAFEPLTQAGPEAWIYAVLSLTVVRMLPVALSLVGLGLRPVTLAFVGWFGPRGLASVLFAVLVIEDLPVPHADDIVQVVLLTVLLSVVAHGMTAAPFSNRYARALERFRRERDGETAAEHRDCPAGLVRDRALDTAIESMSGRVDASRDGTS